MLALGRAGAAIAAEPPDEGSENDAVKFWTEADSVDGRWNQTDVGRFLACVISLPEGPVRKGLSIRVGEDEQATVCYDTEHLALRAIWRGGFLTFDPARYGIIKNPAIDGELLLSAPEAPGWQHDDLQYLGMYVHGERSVLHYRVDGVEVLEGPWASLAERRPEVGTRSVSRRSTLNGRPHVDSPDQATLAESGLRSPDSTSPAKRGGNSADEATLGKSGLRITRAFVIAPHDQPLILNTNVEATPQVTIPPSGQPQQVELVYSVDGERGVEDVKTNQKNSVDVRSLTQGGPTRWAESVIVSGDPAQDDSQPYVIDKITLPMENPYRALMFVGGHGFFSGDGSQRTGDREQGTGAQGRRSEAGDPSAADMAVCTMHGEVWTVDGVDADLDRLEWRRFATGLFQPLGMVVVDNLVHVLGRDQITRLHDLNGDGEADYYENFCNTYDTSAGRHDFITSLERDEAGNFYFAHALDGVMRVSPDGQSCESLATGLRNPNGLGASPEGFVTVAPQQGNWTPSSCIFHVRRGDYYGFGGPKKTSERPRGFDPPLCWIPHSQDNSSGSQAWVTSERWGPLEGQMLHFSYGQCTMMLTLRERVDDRWQGGNIDFQLRFDSGAMRGRFSPRDGQLYVSGLRGWQNRAVLDGCLARVRYTGRPVYMPLAVETMQNGLAIRFSNRLDREAAETASNYAIQRWNYRYSGDYGSPDLRVSNPQKEGRDDVPIASATLLGDGHTVFLEIPDMRPADQYLVQYAIEAADAAPIQQQFSYTVHAVGDVRLDESRLNRGRETESIAREVVEALDPGVLLHFTQARGGIEQQDTRRARMAACYVAAGEPPTPRLDGGPFSLTAEGYLQIRQPGGYRFALCGSGRASLRIGPADSGKGAAHSLRADPAGWIELRLGAGYHPLEIHYECPADRSARLRLWWSGPGFGPEPVPPHVLHHDSGDERLVLADRHYQGRELFVAHNCGSCHTVVADGLARTCAPALSRPAPDLQDAGERLNRDWLTAWILEPQALRDDATMPALLDGLSRDERQQAAVDLAAYVGTLVGREAERRDIEFPGRAWERDGEGDRGELLYERLACLACHRLTPPGGGDEFERVSLHFVSAKYQSGALAAYLMEPHRHHASMRMPDFRLTPDEARALEAYLRRETSAEPAQRAKASGDPARGQKLYAAAGCANCHSVDGIAPPEPLRLVLVRDDELVGCLATDHAGRSGAPAFPFRTDEREAIIAFLRSDGRSLERTTPLETTARLIRDLRCTSCHDRDGRYAPRMRLAMEEGVTGLAPDHLPSLTWTGEKLRTGWIEGFLTGRIGSPRPWLDARMPHYDDELAATLARGLATEHGLPPDTPPEPARTDASLAKVGRQLTQQTALDCRQCHGVHDIAPRGDERTLTAPGINFAEVPARLRREFFLRLLHNPQRIDPRTKMPQLAEGGTTKITEHFDGDAARQFEAIWAYIQSLDHPREQE